MNASEAYQKYKHMDLGLSEDGHKILRDLWSAVKHEHFGSLHVDDVKVNGKSIMKETKNED